MALISNEGLTLLISGYCIPLTVSYWLTNALTREDVLRSFRDKQLRRGCGQHSPELLISKRDRKSTRLNSSHSSISYAVFCLKKKINRTTKDPDELYVDIAKEE